MKTKKRLLFIVIFAISLLGVSAQKLLVSENFSTSAWETEFISLNPAYVTPAVNTALPSSPGFLSGFYKGYELFSGTIECADGLLPCIDGTTVHKNNVSAVAWRLKNKSSGKSYLTLPTVTSSGTFTLHVKTGGTSATNNHIELQRVDTIGGVAVITVLNDWSLASSTATKFSTQVDELKTFWVDSRGPIMLRIGQAAAGTGVFVKIFGFEVEEHASVPLKSSIDSASVIQTANTANIGTEVGQYPQESYDAFVAAIATANSVHANLASTRTQLINGKTDIDNAITTFKASIVTVVTALNSNNTVNTQAYGIKGGIKVEGLGVFSQVSIYGVTGALVKQLFTSANNTIALPKGSYLVKIQTNKSVKTIKTVVR